MPKSRDKVLLTWVARNNDPYERNRDGTYRQNAKGEKIWGPTLTILFDPSSPYSNSISDIVFFSRVPPQSSQDDPKIEQKIIQEAIEEVQKVAGSKKIGIHRSEWKGTDPTDHLGIFQFLSEQIPRIRQKFIGQELIIHISPGLLQCIQYGY